MQAAPAVLRYARGMPLRIASLIASATEMACALGLRAQLVAVSHECDFPPDVRQLPQVTRTRIAHLATSAAIDAEVRAELAEGHALYEVDAAALKALAPDLILTQSLCEVCAVSPRDLARAHCELAPHTQMLNMETSSLGGILDGMRALGSAAGVEPTATAVLAALDARIAAVAGRTATIPLAARPRVAMLEWIDPLFDAGHWNPELLALAGGVSVTGRGHQRSQPLAADVLREAEPDLLFFICCGFDIPRSRRELAAVIDTAPWRDLRAVQAGQIWLADGNAYFNRPGPRIVDSLELLAHALHPEVHPLPPGITPAERFRPGTSRLSPPRRDVHCRSGET